MDIEEADGDIIESSQIPNLRENVRKRRIFYGQPPKAEKIAGTKSRKINKKRQQNNATVSQCMQREWKSPCGSKRPDQIKPAEGPEEFIKFTTQQDEGQSIGYCPSVSLFEKQKDIVQRYMFSETIEAQQEEMLDQVLEGFRTSYEQATARIVDSSPVPTAMKNMSPKVVEDGPRLEPNTIPIDMEICSEPPDLLSQLPSKAIVERHVPPASAMEPIINVIEMEPVMHLAVLPKERKIEKHKPPVPAMEPTVSTIEIEKLCEPILHFAALPKKRNVEPPAPAKEPTVTTIEIEKLCEPFMQLSEQPKVRNVERVMPTMSLDGCLDLSTKRDKSNSYQVRKEEILQLHNPHHTLAEEKRMRTEEYVLQHSEMKPRTQQKTAPHKTNKQAPNTVDSASQTQRGHFFCNVGVQHCPVGSFDMTNYNIMMLARLVGINPNSLYTKIRQMIRASDTRMLWQPRNLSQVFTENDPYYAHLDYFMSPRL